MEIPGCSDNVIKLSAKNSAAITGKYLYVAMSASCGLSKNVMVKHRTNALMYSAPIICMYMFKSTRVEY